MKEWVSPLLNCVKSKHAGMVLISISPWCASYGIAPKSYALTGGARIDEMLSWFATDSLITASTDHEFSMHSLTPEMWGIHSVLMQGQKNLIVIIGFCGCHLFR